MASPKTYNLARKLIASQTSRATASAAVGASATGVDIAAQVVDELRLRLVKLAGIDGFRSLLTRALTLAKQEAPSLCLVEVCRDGTLKGFDDIEHFQEEDGEVGAILVAHLLELLVTFIGEPLTLHLVRDAWVDASLNGTTSAERKV